MSSTKQPSRGELLKDRKQEGCADFTQTEPLMQGRAGRQDKSNYSHHLGMTDEEIISQEGQGNFSNFRFSKGEKHSQFWLL
ncbi:hypothetical protein GJAV_G00075900 [Gymnothorax javanicus]|nr:hypothetical protein GJAV_G00075900 [Gymnothorax javanicus]